MADDKPTYQELEKRLEIAEAFIDVFQHNEVDSLISKKGAIFVQLKNTLNALEESRQELRFVQSALDALSANIVILDDSGIIITANAAWKNSNESSGFIGKEISLDTPVIILTGYGDMKSVIKAIRFGADDYLLKPCDSEEMDFRISRCLDKLDLKKKLVKAEKELLKTTKHESFSIFASGIAHDFNNLLSVIMGYISMANDEIPQGSPINQYLKEAETASIRAGKLTNQFLMLSKGGYPAKKVSSVGKILKKSLGLIPSGSDIKPEIFIHEDLRPIEIDPVQMAHAFNNLIINAYESMKDRGVITVKAENIEHVAETAEFPITTLEKQFVKVVIQDQGNGISNKDVSKIFDPYFSTKQRGAQKGMGLGLATTYSIIKKHNGHIFVETEPEKGTIITIYLPVSSEKIQLLPSMSLKQEQDKIRINKVLVMDDDSSARDIVSKMLERIGYEAHVAVNGEQAVKQYKNAMDSGKPFDLLILDLIVKTGMGGLDTFRILRQIKPDIIAVLSSSFPNNTIIKSHKEMGFKNILSKPYTMKYLRDFIEQIK
ncbi:response regulator [Desulfobacterales bacterium HSG17]|nr:response regulator [Desulfobacterales bacterium HSG17]